ncbi:HAD family hydrolase [Bacillus sp. PS06]|uniref:HAD family hydrolase n=1 Tax=Bacillus sp. PS06 TaxID=2764176 RepID=UPI0017804129|nr:HAD-IA family hydrolase [Bacillus sp. PS06]MBD8071098.1 HAD family hydrolase [Bacillus sp. PS06]
MDLGILNNYDIIIFDCDGVIFDINNLKCEAFGKAIEGYQSNIVEGFVEHCKNTFGVSRYIKFKEFFKDFANEQFQEDKYNKFLKNYANLCKENYKIANITPYTENLLLELSRNKKLYIASGSDEEELKEVFVNRNLSKHFSGIFGSPKTKLECASKILDNSSKRKAVFIGDAITDMKTARELDLDFIYMSRYTVQSEEQDLICQKEAKKVIGTFEDFMTTKDRIQ